MNPWDNVERIGLLVGAVVGGPILLLICGIGIVAAFFGGAPS